MRIAILALQGAFAEHQQMLRLLGVESFLVRNIADWNQPKDGLIIPGGESTAMMKIMHDENLFEPIRSEISDGLPVFGTCAGMILLDDKHLGVMDISVKRNAYGRQLGSFYTESELTGVGVVPMTFIRAPYIERVSNDAKALSTLDGNIIAAQQNNMFVTSFHPELNDDLHVHQYFIEKIVNKYLAERNK